MPIPNRKSHQRRVALRVHAVAEAALEAKFIEANTPEFQAMVNAWIEVLGRVPGAQP